jgi:circadian clock protein KaiC
VVIDPVTGLLNIGTPNEVKSTLMRLIDFLKNMQITALLTALTANPEHPEQTEVAISSLIDTWLILRDIESVGERNRGLMIMKSRGMAHSNQIREFLLTEHGIELQDVYLGPAGVLTGSARLAQEARETAEELRQRQELEQKRQQVLRRHKALEAQIAALQADLAAEETAMQQLIRQEESDETGRRQERAAMARSRQADVAQATALSANTLLKGETP